MMSNKWSPVVLQVCLSSPRQSACNFQHSGFHPTRFHVHHNISRFEYINLSFTSQQLVLGGRVIADQIPCNKYWLLNNRIQKEHFPVTATTQVFRFVGDRTYEASSA